MEQVPTRSKLKLITSMVGTCSTAAGVLSVLRGETPSECDGIVISAAIHRLACTKKTFQRHLAEGKTFRVLLKRARQMLQRSEMSARELTTMLWAMASARVEIPEFQLLAPLVVHELMQQDTCDELTAQQTSNALWAVATLWRYVPDIREALELHEVAPKLAERAATVCDEFLVQGYGNVLQAVGFLKDDVPSATTIVPRLMDKLAGALEKGSFDSDPTLSIVDFECLVSALATLEYKRLPVLDSLAERISLVPSDGKQGSLINICCGFAKLGVVYPRLLRRLAKNRWDVSSLPDWSLAALAWTLDAVDADGTCSTLRRAAHAEASKRGFTKEQIEHSRFGYWFWDEFDTRAQQ